MRIVLLALVLFGCNSTRAICDGVANGEIAICNGDGEMPVCMGEVTCSYTVDGRVSGRTFDSAVCTDELPSCEAICEQIEVLGCVNPPE